MTDSSAERCSRAVLLVAIASAVGLVLPATRSLPLVLDEQAAYWLSRSLPDLSIAERNLGYAASPPMMSWAQAASLAVLGKSEFALRFPSLACYVVAIGVLFLGTRTLVGGWPAALASLSLAWHPDVVDEVRIGRPYGLVLLAMSASLVCTLQLLAARKRTSEIDWGIAWGVTAGVAMWSHIFTIPVLGCSGVVLCLADWRRQRRPGWGTILAASISLATGLPLLPFLFRIWDWRSALNYQTGEASLWQACGPFLWLALPAGALVMSVTGRRRSAAANAEVVPRRTILGVCVLIGVLPLIALVLAASDTPSLINPRYRVPLAAAQALLLGLMLADWKKMPGSMGLALIIAGCWLVVGRLPTTLVRMDAPQAAVWKEIGEEFEKAVETGALSKAPVFVQSGLIEGTLVPILHDDLGFHGYLASRLGTFYADTPNPRYGLPFFWHVNAAALQAAFRSFVEAAPGPAGDVFVAAAVDTDVNRGSVSGFLTILNNLGYETILITDRSPWAVLYHARRRHGPKQPETE